MHLKWTVAATSLCIGLLGGASSAGQTPTRSRTATHARGLTAEDVVKLAKAGLSEDIIIQEIKKNGRAFDLSTEQLIALKTANVSDRVLEVMLDPSKADAPAPARASAPPFVVTRPAPAAPAPPPPVVKRAPAEPELPTEVGVYARKQGQWVEVPPEIVYWKTGGVLKTIATAGVRHGDVNGHVPGASSRTAFATPLKLLIVAPEGTALAEYQLIHMHANKDNREFRTITGGYFHSQSGSQRDEVQFDGKKIVSRVFEVTFPDAAEPGEYGVLPPGSTNGSGKIYSFRVKE